MKRPAMQKRDIVVTSFMRNSEMGKCARNDVIKMEKRKAKEGAYL